MVGRVAVRDAGVAMGQGSVTQGWWVGEMQFSLGWERGRDAGSIYRYTHCFVHSVFRYIIYTNIRTPRFFRSKKERTRAKERERERERETGRELEERLQPSQFKMPSCKRTWSAHTQPLTPELVGSTYTPTSDASRIPENERLRVSR